MSFAARTVAWLGGVVGVAELLLGPQPPCNSRTIPTNAMTARNTPTSRTSGFERFKLGLPEPCDRWHHCSTGLGARDYTNGLGPLGGNGRIPRTAQGSSQGSSVPSLDTL